MLKTPVFFTSFVAMAARLSMSFEHWVFFNSHSVAKGICNGALRHGLRTRLHCLHRCHCAR